MKQVIDELELIAKKGGLTLTNFSLKEGRAVLSCSYAGADSSKIFAWLTDHAAEFNSVAPNKLELQPVSGNSFAFTVCAPKSECRNLLLVMKQQALEVAARIEAEKKARRKGKKSPA